SISEHLDAHGWAILEELLTAGDCEAVAALYADDRHFRSHIVMARHGFGRGEYKYFSYPLPDTVSTNSPPVKSLFGSDSRIATWIGKTCSPYRSWCSALKSPSPYCSRRGVGRVWPALWHRAMKSACASG